MPPRLEIDDDLFQKADQCCPKYLSTTGFINLMLDQALDRGVNVPTCRAGAGKPESMMAVPAVEDLELQQPPLPIEAVSAVQPKSWKPKSVSANLEKFESLIMEFWRVKKGSRGETAWKRLQGQLERFLDVYGDTVVQDQLELAINGKWAGIEFSRFEQYKPTGKNAPKRVERKLSPEEEAAKKEADHKAWLKSLNLS